MPALPADTYYPAWSTYANHSQASAAPAEGVASVQLTLGPPSFTV